ncbi:MAG TPA: HNH endonuclease signature motif containing protein [Candidatus Obscuribacterales bacterium]
MALFIQCSSNVHPEMDSHTCPGTFMTEQRVKKERIPIPDELAARILYEQDRTCCKCNEHGRRVQIHHIDDDPSNNSPKNLAVLCLLCHDETQITGGFGRKLNAALVTKYRDGWLSRVACRREEADHLAASAMAGTSARARSESDEQNPSIEDEEFGSDPFKRFERPDEEGLIRYAAELPSILSQAYRFTADRRNSGVTFDMNEGGAEIADVLEQILLNLAHWFPPKHFDGKPAAQYFNKFVADTYVWHRGLSEPYGEGTGGTIRGQIILYGVIRTLKNAVADMVAALFWSPDSAIDFLSWNEEWEKAGE